MTKLVLKKVITHLRYYSKIYTLLTGVIFSSLYINCKVNNNINAEEFAFGKGTISFDAVDQNGVSVQTKNLSEISSFIDGWRKRGSKDVVLLFGNSQNYGINQMEFDQVSFPQILFDYYNQKDIEVLSNNLPNVNLQEQLVIFHYLLSKLPIKYLILPVFLDDTREDGIRYDLALNINSDPFIESYPDSISYMIGVTLLQKNIDNDVIGLQETFQEKVEIKLDNFISKYYGGWENRPSLRTDIFIKLHLIRNSILGINPSTERKIIPIIFKKNMNALTNILKICNHNNIKPIIYIPPIRNDIKIPYDLKEYSYFKELVREITFKYGGVFHDFDNSIPAEYWGLKETTTLRKNMEIDFMHFTYAGHQILANKIVSMIDSLLKY